MTPLIRYGPTILAALALAGAVWWVMSLRAENAALRDEVARKDRSIAALRHRAEQSAEARRVEEARAERWRRRSTELSDTIDTLKGIPDAPLDPRITDILDGLHAGDGD